MYFLITSGHEHAPLCFCCNQPEVKFIEHYSRYSFKLFTIENEVNQLTDCFRFAIAKHVASCKLFCDYITPSPSNNNNNIITINFSQYDIWT